MTNNTNNPQRRSWPFFTVFALTFVFFLSAANSVGFVPYYVDGSLSNAEAEALVDDIVLANRVALGDLPQLSGDAVIPAMQPTRIIINDASIDLPVSNPTATDVASLDQALLSSVVRYPGSALPGAEGNVLIFGHSSHLPVVHNQMFRAFNNLPDLTKGDFITLQGDGYSYLYQVTSVRHTDAEEEVIDLSANGGARLTLATCDTFGKKSARWVVEADFVSVSKI